ncbi:PTS beta-glucoside transporter subunit IIBCA [Malacoplasma penetrans]|uniref:PTS system sucrose-specific IIABC component n=1 Tax=Malacoplasma penetrans (strain HF-2) TaxID=272633 RepID=Q8EUF9_MALP2|nr:PTS transporter subunit EIIC [Malacoplasma penetrans]RXY96126.1 PTS beta-glucoside transporter subunit IIBCA [Malacoplasma penetrans]BAC44754.1 PTS system sucrose-specific IIABC component [Malacoplasma penetrans HF-2]
MKKVKIDTFKQTVEQLVEALGGIDNINEAFHCATRFRVTLKDDNKVNKDKLNQVEKSKGFSKDGNQWQIIFGTGLVNKVYDKYASMFNIKQTNLEQSNKEKVKWNKNYSIKTNIFQISRSGVRGFASIFIPLIPLFIVGGLSLAFNSIIEQSVGKDAEGNSNLANSALAIQILSKLFTTIGGVVMGSLSVFIGYTAAKRWGGNPWFGVAIGLILVFPSFTTANTSVGDLNNNTIYYQFGTTAPTNPNGAVVPVLWNNGVKVWNFPIFSIPLISYKSQFIPTLIVIAIMVQIEKGMKKISHESIAIITVPLVTVISSVILAFVIIGPIGYLISLVIAEALRGIFVYTNFPGFGLGGAILGAIYAPIVITGLHQGFTPIEAQLLSQYGESWITPIACVSNIAQGFACLTATLFIKDNKLKGTAYSGGISANLGITEPAMFGVNLNVRHYFLAAIIGSAVGGYWVGMTQTTANSLGSASWLGLVQFDFTRTGTNIQNWYDTVANQTPWGQYMNGFNLPPIANIAIAMAFSGLVAFIAAFILSLSKQGRLNLQEVNKGIPNYKFIETMGLAFTKFQDMVKTTFGNLIYKEEGYKKKIEEKQTKYVYSPVDGQLLDLKTEVSDQVFSNELLGKSFVIRPNETQHSQLHSPIDGTITNIFDTGHAITISNKDNVSVLMHIGLETAQINKDASDLQNLKYFKFKKLILSKVKIKNEIVDVQLNELVNNGATSKDIYCSILNETIKENQIVELIAQPGAIKQGQPIYKITTVDSNL